MQKGHKMYSKVLNKSLKVIRKTCLHIAYANVVQLIKIGEDKISLHSQRNQGRPGNLPGLDTNLSHEEERARLSS